MEVYRPPHRHWILLAITACGMIFSCVCRGDDRDVPYVMLTNGNILRGRCETQGNQFLINRDDGTQMRLGKDQIAIAASSLHELYTHRIKQHAFRSANVYAEDIAWCLRNGLPDEAEAEWRELVSLDPTFPLIGRLQRQIESARSPRTSVPQRFSPEPTADNKDDSTFVLPEGISSASVATFATRVQPMLINRCGNSGCHRTGSDTQWKLAHLGIDVRVSSKMTQQNLAAIAPHLNFDDPSSSELLRYLQSPHASGRYQTTGRSAIAAEATLRAWLSQFGRYPSPHVPGMMASPTAAIPMPVVQIGFQTPPTPPVSWNDRAVGDANDEPIPDGFSIDEEGELIYDPEGIYQRKVVPPTGARPVRLPAVDNPFSADLFNRQSHAGDPR